MARAAPAHVRWNHRGFKRRRDGVSPYACRSCGGGLSSGFLLALTRIKSSRLKPLPREHRAGTRNFRRSCRFAAGEALVLARILALDVGGPPAAAGSVDETPRALAKDVGDVPRGQDAHSDNPAASAHPRQNTGGE